MITKLMNKPLMITSLKLDTLFQSVSRVNSTEVIAVDASNPKSWLLNEVAYEIHENIAIIPINGLLTKRREAFDSFFGTTSYEEIHDLISEALEDDSVHSILLDIDSPGGEVSGLFDLTDFIYESRDIKPIHAIANDCACSAAYAIASSASKIFATRTSSVGSIGVLATHIDISEYDKKEGIKYTTIFAGDKKNDLSSHEPITDSAATDLQIEINRLYKMFIAMVARNRNISSAQIKATQAGVFFGSDALSVGLVDEICDLRKCLQTIGGENMADIESKISEAESYKAEVLEITKLCKLAHAESKISEFIEQNLTADQVKEKLLASVTSQNDQKISENDIVSAVYHQEKTQESPVIAAAKLRSINI